MYEIAESRASVNGDRHRRQLWALPVCRQVVRLLSTRSELPESLTAPAPVVSVVADGAGRGAGVSSSARLRAGAALAGLALGWLVAVALPASPGYAHAVLSGSDPAANTVVPQPPEQVMLQFTESVRPVTGRIQVLAPDNSRADDGQPSVAGATVTITLRTRATGTYLVSYRVTSADSHPIAGSFTYSVGTPSARPAAAGQDATAAAARSVRTAISAAKTVGYAGLALLMGPIMMLLLLWPPRLSRSGPARLVWTGLGLTAGSTLAALWLQVPYTTGGDLTDVDIDGLGDVPGSLFGVVLLIRLGVLCIAPFLIRPILSAGSDVSSKSRGRLAALAGVAITTWPLSGHPAASPAPSVSVVTDSIHLTAMAIWLGGLVMLVTFVLPRARDHELQLLLPMWSKWAETAVIALAMTGVIQALIEIGTVGAFFTTAYGRLLLGKLALVATVIAVAGCARRLVRRRLDDGRPVLRRVVALELGIATVILSLTAVLVQTAPARTAAAGPAANHTEQVEQTLRTETLSVRVIIFPARTGANTVHLFAFTPEGKPLPVVEWGATAAMPAAGIEPVDVPLSQAVDNHAIGKLDLPIAGTWRLRVTLRTSEIDQRSATGPVTID
ncbi:copper resistance CopC/CopD family protein [Actinoplanes sp. ATCC 53533]|uniref:copper resistance CopC/CopD family protein n=1 Tax=Actinoplanes sp. ATCC 53533 TaxID=1288362 RepID=UPI001F4698DC|nr:copper resistance protein CopC [Actinoplanes sp. ATCC 53533]